MEIKLYGENDSRPQGTYTKITRIFIYNSGMIEFIRDNGEQIVSSPRYKLTVIKEDKVQSKEFPTGRELVFIDADVK